MSTPTSSTPLETNTQSGVPTQTGNAVMTPPAPMRRTLAFTGIALAVSTVLTGSIARPHRQQFPGHLTAEKKTVIAPFNGTIESRKVEPGQFVCPDQELFTIVDPQLEQRRFKIEGDIQNLEQELCSAQASAQVETAKALDALDAQIFQTQNVLAEQIAQKYTEQLRAKAWNEQFNSLWDSLTSTKLPPFEIRMMTPELQGSAFRIEAMLREAEAENRADTLQTRIEMSENRLKELRARREGLPKRFEQAARVPQLEHQLELARQQLSQLNEPGTIESVKSPTYGMVGNVRHAVTDSVECGATLVEVFDRDHEYLVAALPARLAPTLKPGSKINVHFPDDVLREGEVQSIPPQTRAGEKNEPELEVQVRPTGKVWPLLPIGSTIHVSLK